MLPLRIAGCQEGKEPPGGVPLSLLEALISCRPKGRSGGPTLTTARGDFDVTMQGDSDDDSADGTTLASKVVDKQFHGDLEGTGHGRMVTGTTREDGSAGYVLIERIRGRLDGRTGSFLLQHSGILDRGTPHQSVEVVPDSGSGELAGIRGRMTGKIVAGKHSYEFDYELPRNP
jgi:uncharacterized protein DUF3224